MTDYFLLLEQPRLPWLDLETLTARFHALAAAVHPDRVHNSAPEERAQAQARYIEFNAAYQSLRETKNRLFHLLELERGVRPAGLEEVPPPLMDLGMQVGQLCRQVDKFLAERSGVESPMLKVDLFKRGLEWGDQVNVLQRRLRQLGDSMEIQLRDLNEVWQRADTTPGGMKRADCLPLEQLDQLYRLSSYLARWNSQLQERWVQLSL